MTTGLPTSRNLSAVFSPMKPMPPMIRIMNRLRVWC
jgi:hypothetical protein